MAELTREEFAGICRTTTGIVTTNISRGKIKVNEETKKIDSEDPLNNAFFKKYKKLHEEKEAKKEIGKKIETIYDEVVEKVDKKLKSADEEIKKTNSRAKSQKSVDWYERKLEADTLLQEAKIEKEKIQLEKLAGKLIPIDLVFSILNIHNQSIFATFHNDTDNLASVFCDILAGGDRKKLAEVSQKLSEKLNDCVKRAKEVSLSSIDNAIEEYQEVRSRGEKK